ncbi:MAG TPA: hypothetical protein DCY58_00670, partial [Acetobacterium sp.]|nr:hypothetical protein [Acetobacterium sp.]
MSLFSQRIEELIVDSGETIQSLAEIGKIDRTTLQRVKSGDRLPSKKIFSGLCRALRLSATEEEELKNVL